MQQAFTTPTVPGHRKELGRGQDTVYFIISFLRNLKGGSREGGAGGRSWGVGRHIQRHFTHNHHSKNVSYSPVHTEMETK